jgi:hypothetical protein
MVSPYPQLARHKPRLASRLDPADVDRTPFPAYHQLFESSRAPIRNMLPWEVYVACDTALFAALAFYSVTRLICAAVRSVVHYVSRVILRSVVFVLAFTFALSFLVQTFNPDAPGDDVFQFVVILFAAGTSLAFFYTIQQWDAICRGLPFRPCQLNVFMIVIILLVGMTGTCQLCTYFIRTNASQYVFFFLNSFTLFVQMGFIFGYGCLRVGILLKTLNAIHDSPRFAVAHKTVIIITFILGIIVLFEFGAFVASFCVDLDVGWIYHLFTVFSVRIPMLCAVVSALFFQDLMDWTAEHVTGAPKPTDTALI